MGATGLHAQSGDQGAGEGGLPLFEGDRGGEHLLFVFHDKPVHLKDAFDRSGKLRGPEAVRARQNPNGFHHDDDTEEAGFIESQFCLDKFRRPRRLNRVVLCQISHEDVGIEPDRAWPRRFVALAAPAATASAMSSRLTGVAGGLTIPLSVATGVFGGRTMVPSG